MSDMDRRSFLAALAALPAAAAWPVYGDDSARDHARVASFHALADAVLPAELGAEGIVRAAEQFRGWMNGYQPGAELDHPYGSGTLRYTQADPRPHWSTQLEELDADARARHGRAFDALDRSARRALIAGRLDALNVDRLPAPLSAPHVALALLSWFLTTSTAHDLCYNARIQPVTCRPLQEVTRAPAAGRS